MNRLKRRLRFLLQRVKRVRKKIASLRRQEARATELSQDGAAFIAEFEGFYSKPYNDPAGHCTIGYGTLLHYGNCTKADKTKWSKGVTRGQALQMLHEEASAAADAVNHLTRVKLNQNQLDALVSFVYNVGIGAFTSSTLLKKLNAGDYASVPSEMNRWTHAGGEELPGLVRRRKAEGDLFRSKS